MRGTDVVLVEPYLAGTSASEIADALQDRPHRLLSLGTRNPELRRYGSGAQHRAPHALDAVGIRTALDSFRAATGRPHHNGVRPAVRLLARVTDAT